MSLRSLLSSFCYATVIIASAAGSGLAAGSSPHIERQQWSFEGVKGQFDRAQLQRGFQIYKEVCSACHGLKRVNWRNLSQEGGPQFPEAAVKALAAEWPNQITDGPNDAGDMFERPALLSDPILGPYKNENAARAAQNGALPPDLSLIARARNPEYHGSVFGHPTHMLKDIFSAYQEGGPDYIYALLTGYKEIPTYSRDEKGQLHPAGGESSTGKNLETCVSISEGEQGNPDTCVTLSEGMNYNAAYPGGQIAMPPLLTDGGVQYMKGADGKSTAPETVDQYARDIASFLAWAADPHLNQRKQIGWQAVLFIVVTTILLFIGKKRIWSRVEH